LRPLHQVSAEDPAGRPVTRATAVEIDLIVTRLLASCGRNRQLARITAAELQRNGVFLGIEFEQRGAITVHQIGGRDHFRVEEHPLREAAQEITAMTIRPSHHRCDAECSLHLQWAARRAGLRLR